MRWKCTVSVRLIIHSKSFSPFIPGDKHFWIESWNNSMSCILCSLLTALPPITSCACELNIYFIRLTQTQIYLFYVSQFVLHSHRSVTLCEVERMGWFAVVVDVVFSELLWVCSAHTHTSYGFSVNLISQTAPYWQRHTGICDAKMNHIAPKNTHTNLLA